MFYPCELISAIASARVVGFSGSRSSVPPALAGALRLVNAESTPVYVGDCAGVDYAVLQAIPWATVFSAGGVSRGVMAARSIRFVKALAARSGVLLVFPSSNCPDAVIPSANPSRCFCGAGSGSWATAAYAVGLGVRVFIYSPTGVPDWAFESIDGNWFEFSPATQTQLF
jgi:hypothetical protein